MNTQMKPLLLDETGKQIVDGLATIASKIGGGSASSPMVSVTYDELVALRNEGKLIPGMQYRITDYECTTTQENTRSAGHQFDIIVVADSENALNENARACISDGDKILKSEDGTISTHLKDVMVHYFDGDAITSIFRITDGHFNFVVGNKILDDVENSEIRVNEDGSYSIDYVMPMGTLEEGGFSLSSYFADCKISAWVLKYCLDNDMDRFVWASEDGKGVVFYMKDEWNNECPYDFKNIMFNGEWGYYAYTFNWINDESTNTCEDLSVAQFVHRNDEDGFTHTYGNVIKPYGYTEDGAVSYGYPYRLNFIVFFNTESHDGGAYYGCYSNTFGNECHDITFRNECVENTFGIAFQNNTFEGSCRYIRFGDGCTGNIIGQGCRDIIFKDNCYENHLECTSDQELEGSAREFWFNNVKRW